MRHILKYVVVIITFFSFTPIVKGISNIVLSEGVLTPYFDKEIHKYNVFVSSEVESISITAIKDEEDDYISGTGNINVMDGKTEVTLKVIKKDTSIVNYQINIFKNYEENIDYENAMLSKLEIEGHTIEFDPNVYEYSIVVDAEENLNINYETESEHATVKLTGASALKMGENIIKVIVTSKDKSVSNIYVIKVNKLISVFEESSSIEDEKNILGKTSLTKDEKNIITIVLISAGVIILYLVFFLMFIMGKKRKIR